MEKYNRYDMETDEELIYRICSDKDKIGSWQDVADILNVLLNTEYTESKFRKSYQAFEKMLEANKEKFIDGDAYSKEIDLKFEALRKERIKLQTANVERGRVDRGESRQHMYYEFIGSVKDTIPLPNFRPINVYGGDKEYVCCISDIHFGANFKSENNEYSIEICKDRFELLLSHLIKFIDEKKLDKINILELGDTLQGILRISDLKINETTVSKATVQVSKLIAKFLRDLSEYCYVDYYHVPFANHTQTRNLGTKAGELADEDAEYVISHYIEDLCSNNERINVVLAEEGKQYIRVPIQGNEIIAMHGHTIKNIESSIKDLSMMRREFIDYLFLGHFHGNKEMNGNEGCCNDTEVIVCPSFIGSDPYSDSLMKGSKSSVKIYGFDELYGHTETYKLILN